GLPILFALHGQANSSLTFALYYAAIQIFANMSGLFSGTLLVPSDSEIGSQFFTVILATSLIYAVPKMVGFSDINYSQQVPYWLMSAGIAVILIYFIELI